MKMLSEHYKEIFGCKVYKLSLDGGFSCPNRDGTLGTGGCIFCTGSGEFAEGGTEPISRQLEKAKLRVNRKNKDGKYIASICAAPMIPGRRGLLSGRRAVCYPGFEEYLTGATLSNKKVEVDGQYITACGMGAALDFSLEITKLLKGEAVAEQIRSSVLAK